MSATYRALPRAPLHLYPAAELDGAPAPGYSQGQASKPCSNSAAATLPDGFTYEWTTLAFPADSGGQYCVLPSC